MAAAVWSFRKVPLVSATCLHAPNLPQDFSISLRKLTYYYPYSSFFVNVDFGDIAVYDSAKVILLLREVLC